MSTKQFSYGKAVSFIDALLMKLDDARKLLAEANEIGEAGFEQIGDAHFSYRLTVSSLKRAIGIFDRMDKSPKMYDIYYIIKASGTKSVHCMSVLAGNVKDAKTIVDYMVLRHTQHSAFTKTNGKLPQGWNWEHIAERDGIAVDEIMAKAKSDGYTFA